MRLLTDGTWLYSPKDLIAWLEGDFAAWCEREAAEHRGRGEAAPRGADTKDEGLALAARLGVEHERAHLERLKLSHPDLVEIDSKDPGAVAATLAALSAGAPVVFQGVLTHGAWMGIADFLHRMDGTSSLGAWHYQPWDTKLARSAKPYFLLQLCAYAEMLEAIQQHRPTHLGFILGDGTESSFRTDDFWHYYRRLKRQFEAFQRDWTGDPATLPDPGADRSHGRWGAEAERLLVERDDLSLVAGISRSTVVRLREAGIDTVDKLGRHPEGQPVNGVSLHSLTRVQRQAAMQLKTRESKAIAWTLREQDSDDPRRGLALLPPPSPLDVFYDIEGFPYAPKGLEYLQGAVTWEGGELQFHDWWAHEEQQEKRAFEEFVDWTWERWQRDPTMHIYHYAGYERAALSRLSVRYATREFEVDQLLRCDVLCDLLTVVRQGMVIGTPSYSLKDIEHVYMPPRGGEVVSASGSVVEYQRWIDSGEPGEWQQSPILEAIRDYNRDDCVSTAKLRDWLLERQREAEIPWIPATAVTDAAVVHIPGEAELLAKDLISAADGMPKGSGERHLHQMLGWLLEFHRRDEKPMWWLYFKRLAMEEHELFDDFDCLAGLVRTSTPPQVIKRSTGLEYRFDPDQDTKLHEGSSCKMTAFPHHGVTIESIDPDQGLVVLKVGPNKELPERLSLIPDEHVSAQVIKDAILDYVKQWKAGRGLSQAVDDLLRRRPPRFATRQGDVIPAGGDLTEESIAAVRDLDGGTLAIQGPPGTGKTHTAAHVIAALLTEGSKVGIVANSHAVVTNLLARVAAVAPRFAGGPLWKIGGTADHPALVDGTVNFIADSKQAAGIAAVGPVAIGGTAWLFSRPEMVGRLDYLFIDEAGQVSLANAVAMGRSATNLVLIGDQMQLAQPTQGAHPEESGLSCLEYLLHGHQTIPPETGIFLGTSYRMHPEVCRFISGAYYEGRLGNDPATATNEVTVTNGGPLERGTGMTFLPVDHEGRAQGSEEEVAVIATVVNQLIGSTVAIKGEPTRPMTLDDILIVAPFNLQVRQLKARLGDRARVGSVDKFQGQEAPVVIVSMCASTLDDAPRGAEFLLSPNRLNVAISRAQALAVVVGSPKLGDVRVRSVEEMKWVNGWCRVDS